MRIFRRKSEPEPIPWFRIAWNACALVVVCAFWLVIVELACFAYLRFVPGRYNPLHYYLQGMVSNFHPLFHEAGGEAIEKYYPYVGFFHQGRWTKTKPPVATDPDGWVMVTGEDKDGRDLYAVMDKPKDTLRVVALGGSTMAGMGQSSAALSIPGQIEAALRKKYPDKKIEVLNAAYYTYIAAEEQVLLTTKVLLFKPDLVLVMDGYNEFIRAYYLPDLPPLWGQFQQFMHKTFKRTQSIPGMLSQLGFLLSKRFYCLAIPRVLLFAARTHPTPSSPAAGGRAPALDPKPYDRALEDYLLMHRTMVGVAKANKIPVILALQPNVSWKKPLSDAEKGILKEWNAGKPRYSEAAAVFFPKAESAYNEFIATKAGGAATWGDTSRGEVQLLNLNALFAKHPETLYIDSCHYNDKGAEIVASALAPVVAKGLKLP
ncbi:MAG: hypothetical protein HY059_22845 [Proteobacteria bacterium]|nr:hypothetical protein [Pseudomonadota bacterium]